MIKARSREDRLFDALNYSLVLLLCAIVIYPLYFIIVASFSDPYEVNTGQMWLFPTEISFEGYKRIFQNDTLWLGYRNSLIYMVIGTCINVVLTITGAYPLSRKDFYGRGFFMVMIVFTMFFSGGLIPTYLLVKDFGMVNTLWALIIPNAIVVWNLIVARTFFTQSIPEEVREAAFIDGCSNIRFFMTIVVPLSKAIIAVMVLFYAVSHWNSFFSALIYLRDENKYPLQLVLRHILIQNQVQENFDMGDLDSTVMLQLAEQIKYGAIILASIPVLILYPFLQKYFVKGIMIGSLKG
ncbi:carbohydrate ABC transporter permease [Paenibacillus sp. WQ 127069]|uniref:Carbohydrate ABC transporter permease n=1 Tax=Paenibacillus baimaensis TaxID=2982185 RepID=A0ABT2UD11_9BACL|nr:carbohydrate ABC transporter permease [Paenibacillus sp. WQ 127069]MCU6792527.1 carbohydrate ABC transporter permease [Paenibacillus sp. WQ 127069]